jgi:hypothetical protein
MNDIKRMSIKDFQQLGFLQEANRQFFHPLGLALEVVVEECSHCNGQRPIGVDHVPPNCLKCDNAGELVRLGGVWDFREDPEGIVFGEDIDEDKIACVRAELEAHRPAREVLFGPGHVIQRPGDKVDPSEAKA